MNKSTVSVVGIICSIGAAFVFFLQQCMYYDDLRYRRQAVLADVLANIAAADGIPEEKKREYAVIIRERHADVFDDNDFTMPPSHLRDSEVWPFDREGYREDLQDSILKKFPELSERERNRLYQLLYVRQ